MKIDLESSLKQYQTLYTQQMCDLDTLEMKTEAFYKRHHKTGTQQRHELRQLEIMSEIISDRAKKLRDLDAIIISMYYDKIKYQIAI